VRPIWKCLFENAQYNFCVSLSGDAAYFKAENIEKKINGTEMFKPVKLVRRKTFER
jgi:hypothetical protein